MKMKSRLLFSILALGAICLAPAALAQSAPPEVTVANALTNVATVPLAQETIGIQQSAVMQGASTFESSTLLDYTIKTNFFLRAEIISATAGSGVDAAAIGGGICKSWTATRIYGAMEGRYNWHNQNWEGTAGIGVDYTPFQTGSVG